MATKRETTNHGKQCWEVDYGIDLTGKRHRAFFHTSAEANQAIKDYEKNLSKCGEFWARLKPLERQRTVAILQDIAAKNLTLERVWADHQRWETENGKQTVEPMAYELAVKEWAKRKRAVGKTERYVYHAEADLMKFAKGREQQPIHEFTANELETWINDYRNPVTKRPWSLSSKKTVQALFSSLWTVAIDKGWAPHNIVDRLEPVTRPGREVRIYPNDVVLNLMAAAYDSPATQLVLAPLALGFFGCMRPEEIQSAKAIEQGMPPSVYFGWNDIDLENGRCTVKREIAKTGDQRTIRLQPCAVEWLKVAKKAGAKLPPENETRLIDQCCELIGLDEWIRDGLRKCCATHLRAVYKNDYDVVKDCGNSIRILLKHYADLHTPEHVSMEYWKITPERVRNYLKSEEWQLALTAVEERRKANSATEVPSTQSASETAKPGRSA